MLTRAAQEKKLMLVREKRIREARQDFWEFCRIESPDFYTRDKWHLVVYCRALQLLYERRLTKETFYDVCKSYAPNWFIEQFNFERMKPGHTYTKLMVNMPP